MFAHNFTKDLELKSCLESRLERRNIKIEKKHSNRDDSFHIKVSHSFPYSLPNIYRRHAIVNCIEKVTLASEAAFAYLKANQTFLYVCKTKTTAYEVNGEKYIFSSYSSKYEYLPRSVICSYLYFQVYRFLKSNIKNVIDGWYVEHAMLRQSKRKRYWFIRQTEEKDTVCLTMNVAKSLRRGAKLIDYADGVFHAKRDVEHEANRIAPTVS